MKKTWPSWLLVPLILLIGCFSTALAAESIPAENTPLIMNTSTTVPSGPSGNFVAIANMQRAGTTHPNIDSSAPFNFNGPEERYSAINDIDAWTLRAGATNPFAAISSMSPDGKLILAETASILVRAGATNLCTATERMFLDNDSNVHRATIADSATSLFPGTTNPFAKTVSGTTTWWTSSAGATNSSFKAVAGSTGQDETHPSATTYAA